MTPRLLVDTHILIRWLNDVKKLSRRQFRALQAAERRGERVCFSAISLLEIATLVSVGKLELKSPLGEFFGDLQSSPLFHMLPLTFESLWK